ATALFAGGDGLDVVRGLITGASGVLCPGGLLALEVGASQAHAAAEMIRGQGGFDEPAVRKDLAGRDRIVTARLHARED
ncbi:MAG TPA: hypothetical protein VFH27_05235, partial [Longimicrobiaceae bacterium]|nr:hypothetical protein [Longimicrobiaceae bacterium]